MYKRGRLCSVFACGLLKFGKRGGIVSCIFFSWYRSTPRPPRRGTSKVDIYSLAQAVDLVVFDWAGWQVWRFLRLQIRTREMEKKMTVMQMGTSSTEVRTRTQVVLVVDSGGRGGSEGISFTA